ncbi:hypothetical protein [Mycolicibacter kumamotonensis]|uniref:Uncharacterized protein n=1 Tax=Mycolicibacter kumamotonensis TaxID=354243 RepID=A0A7K3LEA4_9MYCO|nr:hypothetical protein [Mycolicibacter kumamotonensis]NDJ90643.1 hypothetical protein [Mycolicibacter kumamotonensis]
MSANPSLTTDILTAEVLDEAERIVRVAGLRLRSAVNPKHCDAVRTECPSPGPAPQARHTCARPKRRGVHHRGVLGTVGQAVA